MYYIKVAPDAGDHIFSGRMKKLLLRAFVLRRRWSDLADSTCYQYRCRLYRDLDIAYLLDCVENDPRTSAILIMEILT